MKTIEGETWIAKLTNEEFAAWDIYADNHSWMLGYYRGILEMFLNHYRRGIDLNKPLEK